MKTFRVFILILIISVSRSLSQQTNVSVVSAVQDQSEATVAVSPLNSNLLIAAWNDFQYTNNSSAGFSFSTDAGQSWSDFDALEIPSHTGGFDPSVAFDRYGNAFYCCIATGGSYSVYVSRTSDLGITWQYKDVNPTVTTNQDKPFMAIDNTGGSRDGYIYVSWYDYNDNAKIKFAYSDDHGDNFTLYSGDLFSAPIATPLMPEAFFGGTEQTHSVQGAMPVVAPNGDVYVIAAEWDSDGEDPSEFKFRKST